jgi:hypothetical protein
VASPETIEELAVVELQRPQPGGSNVTFGVVLATHPDDCYTVEIVEAQHPRRELLLARGDELRVLRPA